MKPINFSHWSKFLIVLCAAIIGLSVISHLQTTQQLAVVPVAPAVEQLRQLRHQTDATAPRPLTPPKPTILRAFGDIMMGRNVEAWTDKRGLHYPFERMQELLSGADFLIANLEGPVISKPVRTPTGSTRFSFGEAIARTLREEGFNLLSIANNHTFDYGDKGLAETRTFLRAHGVEPFGDPNEEGARVVTQEVRGQKFHFVGFNGFRPSFDSKKAAGVVAELSKKEDGIIVVMMHWGTEYALRHNRAQEQFAHALIDAGADVIFGHHPHVVQDIEVYEGKAIFYSLGNFIFDQYFSKNTQEGLAVELSLGDAHARYTLYPFASKDSQPEVMESAAARQFLAQLAERSSADFSDQIKAGQVLLAP